MPAQPGDPALDLDLDVGPLLEARLREARLDPALEVRVAGRERRRREEGRQTHEPCRRAPTDASLHRRASCPYPPTNTDGRGPGTRSPEASNDVKARPRGRAGVAPWAAP